MSTGDVDRIVFRQHSHCGNSKPLSCISMFHSFQTVSDCFSVSILRSLNLRLPPPSHRPPTALSPPSQRRSSTGQRRRSTPAGDLGPGFTTATSAPASSALPINAKHQSRDNEFPCRPQQWSPPLRGPIKSSAGFMASIL